MRACEGWPHADTLDGLRAAPGWFVEIGYGLAAPYRGRGSGSELVAALAASLLRQPEVSCVVAETEAGNAASRRALEKAGFRLARTAYELR